eukprot:11215784-Lingulodinium_polyedra.AAC.1
MAAEQRGGAEGPRTQPPGGDGTAAPAIPAACLAEACDGDAPRRQGASRTRQSLRRTRTAYRPQAGVRQSPALKGRATR